MNSFYDVVSFYRMVALNIHSHCVFLIFLFVNTVLVVLFSIVVNEV